jgi:hypothetical protein
VSKFAPINDFLNFKVVPMKIPFNIAQKMVLAAKDNPGYNTRAVFLNFTAIKAAMENDQLWNHFINNMDDYAIAVYYAMYDSTDSDIKNYIDTMAPGTGVPAQGYYDRYTLLVHFLKDNGTEFLKDSSGHYFVLNWGKLCPTYCATNEPYS